MNSISFKANYIKPATIKQIDKNLNSYNNCDVSFVEIDPNNKNDVKVMRSIAKSWAGSDNGTYADDIKDAVERKRRSPKKNMNSHIYALTTQEKQFDNLEQHKVLGLTQFEEDTLKPNRLEYLQVNPFYITDISTKKYKHIGTAILNSLKSLYPNKAIELFPIKSAEKFYYKNGFHNKDLKTSHVFWNLNK